MTNKEKIIVFLLITTQTHKMSSITTRKETERTKLIQEKCQTLLTQMLRDEDNKYCVDCDAKGPRWASWNLGIFLCIRCAGIHRNLGVHISRVKSVNLDTWTPEQVISLQQMGNSRARAVYEAQLPDGFRRPQTDTALESFIRAKYEHKKYLAREWLPPSAPKVDWAKEIDDELEKQKRKKKAAQTNTALGIGLISSACGDKKLTISSAALPVSLQKLKSRNINSNSGDDTIQNNDLLVLSSPTKASPVIGSASTSLDFHNESFTGFLSASPNMTAITEKATNNTSTQNSEQNSLAKDEEDFFNQGSLKNISSTNDEDKSGKMTKDSILALYSAPPLIPSNTYNSLGNFGQQPQPILSTGSFAGMAPNYMGVGNMATSQQFITPPNSISMYNAPTLTTPSIFTGSGIGMNASGVACGAGYSAQFPIQCMNSTANTGYTQQMTSIMNIKSGAGSIVATEQNNASATRNPRQNNNQNVFSGGGNVGISPKTQAQLSDVDMHNILSSGGIGANTFQTTNTECTTNFKKQFGNLNINNVWQ